MTATVLVVELALGYRIIDVDGWEDEFTRTHHFVETMHTGRGLFGHALDTGCDNRPTGRIFG